MTEQTQSSETSRNSSRAATLWLVAWLSAGLMLLLLAGAATQRGTPAVAAAAGPARQAYHTKNIEDVRAGEKVWAYDTAAGRWEAREVVRPLTHDYEGDVITVAAGGQKIEATGNHPFWVVRGDGLHGRPGAQDVPTAERAAAEGGRWVEARHLQPGDLLLLRSGELATVEELASRREKLKVYNLEVADLHTYAVGSAGVLVHNNSTPPVTPPGMGDTLYRGAPEGTPRGAEALKGVATPRGSRTDPEALRQHVLGDEVAGGSGVTSWTTRRDIAKRFSGPDGVILEMPRSAVAGREVPRPPIVKYGHEAEVLIRGRVVGATPTRP